MAQVFSFRQNAELGDLPELGVESRSNLLSSAFQGTFAQEMWCTFCGEAIDEADENAGIAEDVRMGSMAQ